jgi:hypothetical protein
LKGTEPVYQVANLPVISNTETGIAEKELLTLTGQTELTRLSVVWAIEKEAQHFCTCLPMVFTAPFPPWLLQP